jgi:hypothetical protein
MKAILLSLSLFLISGIAAAETITMGTVTCGTLKQCDDIPNDKAVDLNLIADYMYSSVTLYVDGKPFGSRTGNAKVITNLPLNDGAGNIIYFSATFSSYLTCSGSGRAHYCNYHWSLVGGTITR